MAKKPAKSAKPIKKTPLGKTAKKNKAAGKKPLPILIAKDAPKRPAPEGGDTPPVPENVRNMKFMLGAMMAAAEAVADLATVIAQGVRDDNAAKRGGIAAGFERAAAYARLQPFHPAAPVAETKDSKP